MRVERITIDGHTYHVVATMSKSKCEDCALNGQPCKELCGLLAYFSGAFSLVLQADSNKTQEQ